MYGKITIRQISNLPSPLCWHSFLNANVIYIYIYIFVLSLYIFPWINVYCFARCPHSVWLWLKQQGNASCSLMTKDYQDSILPAPLVLICLIQVSVLVVHGATAIWSSNYLLIYFTGESLPPSFCEMKKESLKQNVRENIWMITLE